LSDTSLTTTASGERILPVGRGRFAGAWFQEEYSGAARLGIRVRALLHEERSAFQKVSVYDTAFFGRVLTLDDIVMLTERDEFVYHEMLAHVPLCSLPDPRRVLIVGGGDAGVLRECLRHPGLERAVQCDIDERVTRVCEQFFPWTAAACSDPRADLVFDDGVTYVAAHPGEFDVVVIDSTDPIGPASALFSREFYASVARALRPGGIMTAQTESPHWNPDLVAGIYREVRSIFPHTAGYACWMPTYPSGCWTMAYASATRRHDDEFDEPRAALLEPHCKYYNREVHRGAFALPTFVRDVVDAETDPFAHYTEAQRTLLEVGDEDE
jgi:spermidine synthase